MMLTAFERDCIVPFQPVWPPRLDSLTITEASYALILPEFSSLAIEKKAYAIWEKAAH